MDDLDHSVYMAEQDWDSFFQESEECHLQQGALAGLDDSGLSDFDEAESCLSSQKVRPSLELGSAGPLSSIDSPPELEGLPVGPHESSKGLHGPGDSLSPWRNDETIKALFESDEDPAELGYAGLVSADLSKDSSLDKLPETTEPAGACTSAYGADIYQETARDREDAMGSMSGDPRIQINAAIRINLSAETVPQGEVIIHASDCADVTSALSSLQACNEQRYYRTYSEGEAYSVLKGSQEGTSMEIEKSNAGQSPMMRPSTSFFDPQTDSMNTEAQTDANIPALSQHLSDCEKPLGKEKERWFVTVNVGQTQAREKTWPPAKKKRKKKSCSEDGPELGTGSEGQASGIQSNLGAERLGVFEPHNREIDNNFDHHPPNYISATERPSSCESAEPTTPTITQHHKLKNYHSEIFLSKEPSHVFQTICEFDEHKVNYQKSKHVDNHQEQQRVLFGLNLQMNGTLEGQLALKQQNDSITECSQPICTEISGRTEPSKPTTVTTPNCPNHQNLLVKLLFSTQSDTGCEMLVVCRDSQQENILYSQEDRSLLEGARAKKQSQHCVQHSKNDDTSQNDPGHSTCSSETSISVESPEFSKSYVFDSFPGPHSLHNCLSADQIVDLEPKRFLSKITEVPKPGGLLLSEINNGSGELYQSKYFVTRDEVQNRPKIQKDYACPDQEVKISSNEPVLSKETSMTCSDGAERGDAPAVIPERDSTLSATDNTQPPTVNLCLLTVDQQSLEKKPYLEPATLHPIDTAISNECSVDLSTNESSAMMLRDSIFHDRERNKNILTGNGLCRGTENRSQTDSVDHLPTQISPEFLHPPLDSIRSEEQELESEEALAADMPTAGLSAVKSPESPSKGTVEDEPVFHMGDLEVRELDSVLDSTRPVYAISSFWDEMEKLTINDILHLRLVSNAQYPRDFPHLQDLAAADVTDAADSGYFAHPDDSKPDRWTGDASLFSDFEDELQHTLSASTNPSPVPQDAKSHMSWSPEPSRLWWESEQDPACLGPDDDTAERIRSSSEDSISQQPFSDSTQNQPLCQTATVQNLQTVEGQAQTSMPLPVTVRREDGGSMPFSLQERPVETHSLALTDHENDEDSSPLPLHFGKGSSENYVMSFPEISKPLFGESEAKTSLSDRASPIVVSLPETNLSGNITPIVYSLSETNLSDRANAIVVSLPETSLSSNVTPIVYSLSETNLSARASPIVYSLSETNLTDRSSPIVVSLPETGLSGNNTPIVYSLSETNLSERATPFVYSLSETNLSDRASPIVVSLPETNLSGRTSPFVYSLSETNLSDRASPIVCSESEIDSLTGRSSPAVSFCDMAPSDLSLPETYDYFFSDYDPGDVFFPPIQKLGNHTDSGVPIFSCSRSEKREFRFVEEYDFIFPEGSPVESEDEDMHTPVHVVTRFDDRAHDPLDAMVGADAYENFFTDKDFRGNLFWRNLLSLRRLRFRGGLYSPCDVSTSRACAITGWRERSSLLRLTDPGNAMDNQGTSCPHPNLYLENQLCNELGERRDREMQAVVSFPKKAFLFTLKQSDICLVCIAFASWVLKSANPQSADTWKTALLANVSAISAIQYLRRYMREDASENRR